MAFRVNTEEDGIKYPIFIGWKKETVGRGRVRQGNRKWQIGSETEGER